MKDLLIESKEAIKELFNRLLKLHINNDNNLNHQFLKENKLFNLIFKFANFYYEFDLSDDDMPVLTSYIRSMLRVRIFQEDQKNSNEYFIIYFIFRYIKAFHPSKIKLIKEAHVLNINKNFVDYLINIKDTPYLFTRYQLNFIYQTLLITEKCYTANLTTNLYNRDGFEVLFNEYISKTYLNSFAIISIDIDKFKSINDTYSHFDGDNVIQELGYVLNDICNDYDKTYACRRGGDEFSILLLNCDELKPQVISKDIQNKFLLKNQNKFKEKYKNIYPITTSIGIYYTTVSKDINTQFEYHHDISDKQLYLAKDNGRNCICFNETIIKHLPQNNKTLQGL